MRRRNFNKNFERKNKYKKEEEEKDVVRAKFVEVKTEQCRGDTSRMIKKFMKKIRTEEILKPFYGKLAYFETKSQKKRKEVSRGIWLEKKRNEKNLQLEKDFQLEKIEL